MTIWRRAWSDRGCRNLTPSCRRAPDGSRPSEHGTPGDDVGNGSEGGREDSDDVVALVLGGVSSGDEGGGSARQIVVPLSFVPRADHLFYGPNEPRDRTLSHGKAGVRPEVLLAALAGEADDDATTGHSFDRREAEPLAIVEAKEDRSSTKHSGSLPLGEVTDWV